MRWETVSHVTQSPRPSSCPGTWHNSHIGGLPGRENSSCWSSYRFTPKTQAHWFDSVPSFSLAYKDFLLWQLCSLLPGPKPQRLALDHRERAGLSAVYSSSTLGVNDSLIVIFFTCWFLVFPSTVYRKCNSQEPDF